MGGSERSLEVRWGGAIWIADCGFLVWRVEWEMDDEWGGRAGRGRAFGGGWDFGSVGEVMVHTAASELADGESGGSRAERDRQP